MTLLVTLTSIYVPLQLAFEDIMDSFDPEYFVLAFFWVDIVLTLRTTYFDEDTDEIIDPVIIANKYIKSWNFLIDVCSALPISEIITRTGAGKNIKWVVLTKSLRLLRINRLIRYLNDNSLKILYKILRYFFAFLLVVFIFLILNTHFVFQIHWVACMWYAMAYSIYRGGVSNDSNSWVPSNFRATFGSAQTADNTELVIDFYENTTNSEKYKLFNYL